MAKTMIILTKDQLQTYCAKAAAKLAIEAKEETDDFNTSATMVLLGVIFNSELEDLMFNEK